VSCRRTPGLPWIAALAVTLCLTACRQSKAPGVPSVALLPFDNLNSDRGYDWLAAAGPALLDYQLFGQQDMTAFAAPTVNDAVAKHATSYLYGRFRVEAGTLVLDAAVEDAAGNRITMHRSFREKASPQGILAAVDSLAHALAPGARHINSRASPALVPYGGALLSADPRLREALLQDAIARAPDFIPAWLARIELDARMRSGSADDIAAAMRFADALDQARLRYFQASLSGDSGAQIAALADLTRLAPAQASAWQTLAELQTNARNFPSAAAAWTAVTTLQPWNDAAFNQLGYCRAWAGDADGATRALAEYQRLDPQNPNPLDSLGEVQFFLGRYTDAEASFLHAHQKDPAFLAGVDLLKGAEARLMTGDRNGADRLFQQFLDWRRNAMHDPMLPLWKAQWDFLTGRRRAAMSELAAALPQFSGGEGRSRAEAQYAFWLFASGDRAGACTHADEAVRAAQTPESRGVGVVAGFLALPSAPAAEWASRANVSLAGVAPQFRGLALAWALALDHHPGEAIPLLQRSLAASAPGDDGQQRAMLASALLAAGRPNEAHKLLGPVPIPISSDDATFAALVFPRWLGWAGQDAKFHAYSGDLHLVFE
jgi:tetratricopeptide (TPR) repeat protein